VGTFTTLHTFDSPQGHQYAHQTFGVDPIGLRVATATADLDARGIENLVVDPLRNQKAVQPKSVVPSFITGADFHAAGWSHRIASAFQNIH
jgi:hypothetical protein